VVLAGGAGLLAVGLVDPGSLRKATGRTGRRSLRAPRQQGTPRAEHRRSAPPTPAPVPEPLPGPDPLPVGREVEVVAVGATGPALRRSSVPVAADEVPTRRRRRGGIPRQFTAVEGSYRDVAVTPLWRKLTSLVLLLAVLFGAGVGLAAVAAASLGAVAQLVDRAIG